MLFIWVCISGPTLGIHHGLHLPLFKLQLVSSHLGRSLRALIFTVNVTGFRFIEEAFSERLNWGRESHFECVWHHSLGYGFGLDANEKESGAPACICHCLESVDGVWATASFLPQHLPHHDKVYHLSLQEPFLSLRASHQLILHHLLMHSISLMALLSSPFPLEVPNVCHIWCSSNYRAQRWWEGRIQDTFIQFIKS